MQMMGQKKKKRHGLWKELFSFTEKLHATFITRVDQTSSALRLVLRRMIDPASDTKKINRR